ncbi:MAG TPA: cytochrome d ubiquinol oxidase subunit II [Anaerolineae bacterium]|nr:cytochrome d ubiquinol oxidase subunit II [Anaerolineae bacterium]
MDLNTVWFILITVLFTGFFFLEGFDYGVGILLPFLGKDDLDRRVIINAIGPVWDGNEVWLLTAGGAIFAAFPHWYATMFSGFYLALVLLLVALIVRGVAFEFRGKDARPGWRSFWDWMIFFGSLVPALLWGVALGNLLQGVPIDANKNFTGDFFSLISPYTLITGVYALLLSTLHGAVFLSLKTDGEVRDRARAAAWRLWVPAVILAVVTIVSSDLATDMFKKLGVNPGVIPITGIVALLASGWFIRNRHEAWAFISTGVTIAFAIVTIFMTLFPRVMVSSLNPDWSLTIYNASSTPYTLSVMTVVALISVPIVLVYQGWTYWVFRQRVTRHSIQAQ